MLSASQADKVRLGKKGTVQEYCPSDFTADTGPGSRSLPRQAGSAQEHTAPTGAPSPGSAAQGTAAARRRLRTAQLPVCF